MFDFMSPLLQWLNANPQFAGLVTFIVSASESLAVVGTIVPGSITMTAIGALAGAGVIPLGSTIVWAILGAIVGDSASYWIGYYFKDGITKIWPFRHYPSLLESGEAFVHKYGVMSVFIGRFVGPVRALVPVVAGMLGMRPLSFTIANVASAIVWGPAYMAPGLLLGAASLELPPDIAIHVMMVLLLISLFVILCIWITYELLRLSHNQIDQMQNRIWLKLKDHPTLIPLTNLLKHHDPTKKHGQLTLPVYSLITLFLFTCLAIYVKHYGSSKIFVNDALFHLFRGIHTESLNTIAINITILGQKQVLLPLILIIIVWMLLRKHWQAAYHVFTTAILAAGSVYLLKRIILSPRPWGIAFNHETFSMPSGHTSLGTAIFMGLAFFLATSVRPTLRMPIYILGILFAFMIGISRLYLGAHWFTDVVSGWLIGSTIVMLMVISYERGEESKINPIEFSLVIVTSLVILFSYFHYYYFDQLKLNYRQLNWPRGTVSMNEWWRTNKGLPAYNVSLFGFPSQAVNIVWAGDFNQIRDSLHKEGWEYPPARDWISTLHRIADVKSTEYLSMISPQYLDKKPELILVRRSEYHKGLLVLRLWNSNRTIINKKSIPLWVGTLGVIPRSYSWIYKSRPGEIEIDPNYVFPKKKQKIWQWKVITMILNQKKYKVQRIMLIRGNVV